MTPRSPRTPLGQQSVVANPEARGDQSLPTVRVFLLTHVRLYAEGLARILERKAFLEVVGATASVEEAVRTVTEEPGVDVMLIDMQPPEGPEIVRRLRKAGSQVRFAAFAVPESEGQVIAWAEAGISGFLPSDGSLVDLVEMIRCVARGETICPPSMAGMLVRRVASLAENGGQDSGATHLTSRELQIVRLIGRGLSNKEIARSLRIALPTVKNHIHNVLEKLQVQRRSDAVSAVLRAGRERGMDLEY